MSAELVSELKTIGCHSNGGARCTCAIGVEAAECIEQLEQRAAEWQAGQSYRYIGRDGKPVLARDLEARIEQLERELAEVRGSLEGAMSDSARFCLSLAAEKALADQVYEALYFDRVTDRQLAIRSYRKARGM